MFSLDSFSNTSVANNKLESHINKKAVKKTFVYDDINYCDMRLYRTRHVSKGKSRSKYLDVKNYN